MPKPRGKAKSKTLRPTVPISGTSDLKDRDTMKFVEDIDGTEGRNTIITILCEHLEVPGAFLESSYVLFP